MINGVVKQCAYIFSMLLCYSVAHVVVAQNNSQAETKTKTEPEILTEDMATYIADDEVVQFFRTAAVFNAEQGHWQIPIHGWVYEPQKSRFRKAIFSFALNAKYNLNVDDGVQAIYERRLNLLIADNERGKTPTIFIGGHEFTVAPSAPNGHFSGNLALTQDVVAQHRQGDILPFYTQANDGRQFHGQVRLIKEEGLSVISDIDDTIKISAVLDHQQLIDNTFLKPFQAVAGMSTAYQGLSAQVDAFHFVSSSPWQLYGPLEEFVDDNEFPWATFSLKAIRFRDMTLFDLFKPGTATKPQQIEALLQRFSKRRFILVGDSGEQDPEVYAGILDRFPDRIEKILIRNITTETLDNDRFSALVKDETRWLLFDDPSSISP